MMNYSNTNKPAIPVRISWQLQINKMPRYRREDRAMRPMYGTVQNAVLRSDIVRLSVWV